MQHITSKVIDDIVRDNYIFRFASELQQTSDEERKDAIRSIINKIQYNNPQSSQDKLSSICNNIDEFLLKKTWGRLNIEQKINRIKFYMEGKDDDAQEIIDMLKNGTLKNSDVDYDKTSGCIKSIQTK